MHRTPYRIRWAAFGLQGTIVGPWPCLFGVERAVGGRSVRCTACHRTVTDSSVGVVTHPSRQAWHRGDAVAAVPRTGDPYCADCAHTWYGLQVDEIPIASPTARWTCWGAMIPHARIVETEAGASPRYGYRLLPDWRSRLWGRPTWQWMSHADHRRRWRAWPLSAGAVIVRNS